MTAGANSGDLSGLVAVVTGAAQGIGQTIAQTLAEHGASLALLDLQSSDETADLVGSFGTVATCWKVDVTDETEVASTFEGVSSNHGQIDILINNAGVALGLEHKPFRDLTVEEWDFAMAVNVRSVFLCSRAVAPIVESSDNGRIVNLASDVVSCAVPNWLHYVASKAAVVGRLR